MKITVENYRERYFGPLHYLKLNVDCDSGVSYIKAEWIYELRWMNRAENPNNHTISGSHSFAGSSFVDQEIDCRTGHDPAAGTTLNITLLIKSWVVTYDNREYGKRVRN